MAHTAVLPIIAAESGFTRYLEEIQHFPMLEPRQGYMPAKRWREDGDHEAVHRLVTDHVRRVSKIAASYRGDDGDFGDWEEWPVDEHDSQEAVLAESAEMDNGRAALSGAREIEVRLVPFGTGWPPPSRRQRR